MTLYWSEVMGAGSNPGERIPLLGGIQAALVMASRLERRIKYGSLVRMRRGEVGEVVWIVG